MDNHEWIAYLRRQRSAWETLLAQFPAEQLTTLGAGETQPVQEIIDQVSAGEARLVQLLEGAARSAPAAAPEQVFARLVELLEALPVDAPGWSEAVQAGSDQYRRQMAGLQRRLAAGRSPYQTIRSLRAVRHFLPDPLPAGTLQRILQAGRWAGSSKNVQPWQFITIQSPDTLADLATCGRFAGHLRGAALAVVLVMEPNYISGFDAGRAAQNMMLAAWCEGVGSCIASMHDESCARKILGVPADRQVQVAISFGYPDPAAEDTIEGKPRRSTLASTGRKPLEELLHRERWNEPD